MDSLIMHIILTSSNQTTKNKRKKQEIIFKIGGLLSMLHLLSLHVAITTRQMMYAQKKHNHSHVTSDP